ncbi:MAG: bicyclomycin resistance protein [Betaproteobacteria bacterium]|nr:bicyclomycin resistance protein [Betaproteobacteria bacterium]
MMFARFLAAAAIVLLAAAPAAAADAAKVFRYAFPIAETGFDPVELSDLYSGNLIANIFDPPLEYDYVARPMKLVPNTLVAMPEVTENGTLYTMRVKEGIYFVDDPSFKGKRRELVAQDYIYSIKRVFDPKKKSPNLYLLEGQIAGMDEILAAARKANRMDYDTPVEGLRAIDRYTFQIRLKQPNYNFLYYLAYCNLTCALAREADEFYGDKIGENPVGTGPYRLTFWKRSSKMVFEANPGFREQRFDGEPAPGDERAQAAYAANKGKRLPMVGKVEVYIVEENQPRWLAFLNAEHDYIERVPDEFSNVVVPNNRLAPNLARRGIQLDRQPGMEVTYSYFAMKDPVIGGYTPEKVALRRAIVLGQDVETEIRIPRKNQAIPAYSPIGPGAIGYDPDFRSTATEYNPARAKALLDMFGYEDCDGDGYRDLPRKSAADECKPFSIEYASRPEGAQKPLDENWKKNMDGIGIRMTFKKAKWPDLLKESKAGKLQMWGLGWSAAIPDADVFFVMLYGPNEGQANHSRFSLPEFDRLYEQARRLPNGPERNALYREMNRLFLVYAPWRLGVHRYYNDLVHPWVTGYYRHPVMRGTWKFVDIDLALLAAAGR